MESFCTWPTLDLDEDESNQNDNHQNTLVKKFGKEVMNKLDSLVYKLCLNDNSKNLDILNEFVYQSGLCNEFPLCTNTRTSKTLGSLLRFYSSVKQPFSIVDVGCGEGRVTLGLASYLTQMSQIFAVDYNPAAIVRLNKNIQLLGLAPEIIDKIVTLEEDYSSLSLHQKLREQNPDGVNYLMALYTFENIGQGKSGRIPLCDDWSMNQLANLSPQATIVYGNRVMFPTHFGQQNIDNFNAEYDHTLVEMGLKMDLLFNRWECIKYRSGSDRGGSDEHLIISIGERIPEKK